MAALASLVSCPAATTEASAVTSASPVRWRTPSAVTVASAAIDAEGNLTHRVVHTGSSKEILSWSRFPRESMSSNLQSPHTSSVSQVWSNEYGTCSKVPN